MYKKSFFSIVIIFVMFIGGCASNEIPSRQTQGTIAGGVVGGLLGSQVGDGDGQIIATGVGTLIGALVGSHIGTQLDELDRYRTGQILETTRTGNSQEWVNPDSGTEYRVTSTRTYDSGLGAPCREFTLDALVGGSAEQVYGTACRQNDGSWKMTA